MTQYMPTPKGPVTNWSKEHELAYLTAVNQVSLLSNDPTPTKASLKNLEAWRTRLAAFSLYRPGVVAPHDAGVAHRQSEIAALPPLPHPQASDLSLGPNKGGGDAIILPSDPPAFTNPSGMGGLFLVGGIALLAILLFRRK